MLTKMDNRQLKLNNVRIDLEEFLEERIEALEGISGNCRILLEVDSEEIFVKADPELLGRIIQNIISNCVRYAESKVTVRLYRTDDNAVIFVEDDGAGFTDEDLLHGFEPVSYTHLDVYKRQVQCSEKIESLYVPGSEKGSGKYDLAVI